jgi:hypothetical protein
LSFIFYYQSQIKINAMVARCPICNRWMNGRGGIHLCPGKDNANPGILKATPARKRPSRQDNETVKRPIANTDWVTPPYGCKEPREFTR